MLFVSIQAGPDRYALQASSVTEIVPFVELRKVVLKDSLFSGVFDYRQEMIPVIDLQYFLTQQAAEKKRSTRILLIQLQNGTKVGLLAEGVTQTLCLDDSVIKSTSVNFGTARHLGPVIRDEKGYIQVLVPEFLIPAQLSGGAGLTLEHHESPAV